MLIRCRLCGQLLKPKQVYHHFRRFHREEFLKLVAKWCVGEHTTQSFVGLCVEEGLCEVPNEQSND